MSTRLYTPTRVILGKGAEESLAGELEIDGARKVLIHYGSERIVKEDALRHAKSHTPNYKEPTEPVTSKRSSAFLALRTYAERNGGEVYSPDAQTFVVRTNVPGFSVVAKETPTGEVSLSLRNGYGNILSSVGAITSTKQFDAFLRKEGLSLSKNTAIDVNLSSSAAYSEIRR